MSCVDTAKMIRTKHTISGNVYMLTSPTDGDTSDRYNTNGVGANRNDKGKKEDNMLDRSG